MLLTKRTSNHQPVYLSLILLLGLVSFMIQSCQDEPAQQVEIKAEPEGTPATVWLRKDTMKIKLIDSLVGVTRDRMYKDMTAAKQVLHFEDAPLDSADVYIYKGELINVSYRYFDPGIEIWNDFFLKDGNVFFMRHREWNKRPEAHSAREVFFYFDNQERLEYAKERYKVLGLDSAPADLLWEPYVDYSRTLENAQTYIDRFWPIMRPLVEQKLASETTQ